jgi:hypothetical protein
MSQILGERLKQVPTSDAASQVSGAPGRLLAGPFYFSATVARSSGCLLARATDVSRLWRPDRWHRKNCFSQGCAQAQEAARPIIEELRKVEVFGLAKNYPLNWPGRVDAVAEADIQRVAKRLLEANAMTVVVVGKIDDQIKSQR